MNGSESTFSRKEFLAQTAALSMGAMLSGLFCSCSNPSKRKTILVISGWQDVNIGDIAHTPGLLLILQKFLPDAKIILWKRSRPTDEVKKLLEQNFPNIKIIYGNVDKDRNVDSRDVIDAFAEADLMIHGSGPSVVAQTNLEAWVKNSEKPFGIFGVTIASVNESLKALLTKASFIYTRETDSINVLKNAGISGRHVGFAPDATFYMTLQDAIAAKRFMKEKGLLENQYICAIPRLRKTPYYKIYKNDKNWTPERIRQLDELNNMYKEQDHAKLRQAMITWVRKTGNKIVVCPEMTYQVDIMDELLIDPLPDDVKSMVVKHGYWMPDEAAFIYAHSLAVLSFECHTPILALANGTPAFYLRQPQDTIKGQMYYDLGFSDWIFEIEESTGQQIADQLMRVYNNTKQAGQYLAQGMHKVEQLYEQATDHIIANLNG